jgi:DNA-directed RNA polymerase specialized sigma54-like protein
VFFYKLLNRTPWGERNHSQTENGVRVSDLATQFGMTKSTICTIVKNRQTIKKANDFVLRTFAQSTVVKV